ncbi:MAG: hypothetical protein NG784_06220 [Candidatus Jettenia sp.]|nr:hypothetical protein [Candidatus Jettenia sp.]
MGCNAKDEIISEFFSEEIPVAYNIPRLASPFDPARRRKTGVRAHLVFAKHRGMRENTWGWQEKRLRMIPAWTTNPCSRHAEIGFTLLPNVITMQW